MQNNQFKEKCNIIQEKLSHKIVLENKVQLKNLKLISGVDVAYWDFNGVDYAVCCIVTLDYITKEIVEKKHYTAMIEIPYMAGYLSFRELPLVLETYKLLEKEPDIIMFDGNGYLHYRHMGLATHASFYLDKPTIGVAKSYLKIEDVEFTMPENIEGAYSEIIINDEIYGRALRTHKDIKPIFVSPGNWIDFDTATNIVLSCINNESRIPIPTRLADIETKKMRKKLKGEN